jgi:tetratricopeptide (TPR) repeat protein
MFGYEFAVIEIQSGNHKNALKIAEAVKENNAEDSSPYVIYAYSERMKGNYDKAIKYTDEGIVLDSQNPDLYRQKAIALMLKKDFDGAKKELETGLGISEYGVLYYTYLIAATEAGDTATVEKINTVLENAGLKNPEKIQNYLDGKLTYKEIFTEGTGDIE